MEVGEFGSAGGGGEEEEWRAWKERGEVEMKKKWPRPVSPNKSRSALFTRRTRPTDTHTRTHTHNAHTRGGGEGREDARRDARRAFGPSPPSHPHTPHNDSLHPDFG